MAIRRRRGGGGVVVNLNPITVTDLVGSINALHAADPISHGAYYLYNWDYTLGLSSTPDTWSANWVSHYAYNATPLGLTSVGGGRGVYYDSVAQALQPDFTYGAFAKITPFPAIVDPAINPITILCIRKFQTGNGAYGDAFAPVGAVDLSLPAVRGFSTGDTGTTVSGGMAVSAAGIGTSVAAGAGAYKVQQWAMDPNTHIVGYLTKGVFVHQFGRRARHFSYMEPAAGGHTWELIIAAGGAPTDQTPNTNMVRGYGILYGWLSALQDSVIQKFYETYRGCAADSARHTVLVDGHSIDQNFGTQPFGKLVAANYQLVNIAQSGYTTANLDSTIPIRIQTILDRVALDTAATGKQIFLGASDYTNEFGSGTAAQLAANAIAYHNKLLAAGAYVAPQTMLPDSYGVGADTTGTTADTKRQALNSAIRTQYGSSTWDIGNNATTMGSPAATANAALYPDGRHPSQTGMTAILTDSDPSIPIAYALAHQH